VGVAGLNRDGFKSHSSNFGSVLEASGIAVASGDDGSDGSARWNMLADPGVLSTHNTGTEAPGSSHYAYLWGTSFAAPQVAGAISLMLSVNPGLSYGQIVDGLRKSARPHVVVTPFATCSWRTPAAATAPPPPAAPASSTSSRRCCTPPTRRPTWRRAPAGRDRQRRRARRRGAGS